MKKLILGCLLALFASGCNDNEPEQKPVELKISFAGENPVEFTVGEQKRLAFTVTGDDLEGLTFAAEPDEALSGWTVVVSAGREGDAYAGALDVTASATPSETAVTLTVTDRNGKPWSATTPTLTAVQAPVTAIDLSRDGTANCYIVSEAGDYMFDAAVRGNGSGDDAAIALADGMKADWLWVTKGLEQEISAVSLDAGKGRELLGPGGQQEIAAGVCKKLCRVCGRLKENATRRKRAFGPEQAVVFDAGGFTRRPDVFGGVHRIGMGGVHAEGGPLQQGGHFLRRQPPAVDGDTLQTALLFGSQRGRYADEDFGPLRG